MVEGSRALRSKHSQSSISTAKSPGVDLKWTGVGVTYNSSTLIKEQLPKIARACPSDAHTHTN